MAAVNGRQPKQKLRSECSFEGGVNTGVSLFAVKKNETTEEVGFDTDTYPGATVRNGRSTYGSSGAAVTRLLANFKETHLVRAVGTALQYNSSGTTWSAIAGSYTNADWDYTNFNDRLIMTNGTDDVKSWNGSALSNLNAADAPKGKYITSSLTRVYIAHGDSISFCAFLAETDWTTAEDSGTDQFYTPDGGDITGLTFFRDQVTAFKRRAMAVYYGNNYFNQKLVVVSNDIGCISFKTIVEVGETLFFLGENDVFVYQGGQPVAIGQRIREYLNRINTAQESKCCAFTDGLKYYLCLPLDASTEPDFRLVYDPRYGIWRVCAEDENYRYGARLNNVTYMGDSSGQTWKPLDGTTDNGTAVSWSLTTGPRDEGVPEAEKTYLELHLQGYFPTGTTLAVAVSTSDRDGSFTALSYDPTTASDYGQNRNVIIPLDDVPMTHKARFRLSGTGPAEIEQMQLYYRVQRIQR